MDIGALSSGLAQDATAGRVDVGVLKAMQNLDQSLAAELFGSLGLGTAVDAYA